MPPESWRELDLVCPACRGGLAEEPPRPEAANRATPDESELVCRSCGARYPVVLDIPDLRTRPDPYIGSEDDRAKGRTLEAECSGMDFPEALEVYYGMTPVVTEAQARVFIASVLAAADRARETLASFEGERGLPEGRLLDLGCGTAPLAVEAADRYAGVVGIDLAFRWLVMARIRLASAGVRLPLICACAEALPFPDGSFARVIGESVIELLEDQELGLEETLRVMTPGADLYLTTPNRFSLGPDPHVGLPAGGYLPEGWIAAYMRKRGGVPPRRRLLSADSLHRVLAGAGFRDIQIGLPRLGSRRIAGLAPPVRLAARAYEAALGVAPFRGLLRRVGPLLSASAVKPAAGAVGPNRS